MKNIHRHGFAALAVSAVMMTCGWALQAGAQTPAAASAPPASHNVYMAGGTVRPGAAVEGDFIAVGGRVVADQAVKGDALLAGGSVDVRAPVGDDLRTAGGDVSIESTIGGELYAAGGNVTLTQSAQVQKGAALAGALVTIDGKINGKLRASAQRIVLNGEVTGDARLIAERIELGPTARISGALHHTSREMKRAEGAVIGGALTRDEPKDDDMNERRPGHRWERQWQYSGPSWAGMLFGYLGLLAAGAVFVLLFPKFSADAPQMIRSSPWQSLAIGFGVLVGVPVLAVLLFITLLGIPLGIAAFALYPLLLLIGYLAGVLFVAQLARQRLRKDGAAPTSPTLGSTMAFVALALLILMLIGRLPLVGALTLFITTIAGIGACVLEWHRRRQAPPTPPA